MASGWASVMGREQTGVDHLNMLPALDSPGASDLDHLSGCGEVHPGGSLDGLDSTPHPPPMTGIDPGGGWDVLPGQGLERLAQSLLVAQRREKVVTTTPGDPPGCACLGVHRIGAHHHPFQVQRFKKLPERGDLVGLACHSLLGQHGAGGVVQSGQEMRRRVLAGAGPTHGLAVHRDDCSSFDGAGACAQPGPQVGINVSGVQVLQNPADGRLRRKSLPRLHP